VESTGRKTGKIAATEYAFAGYHAKRKSKDKVG
jgi:hypothetical protein